MGLPVFKSINVPAKAGAYDAGDFIYRSYRDNLWSTFQGGKAMGICPFYQNVKGDKDPLCIYIIVLDGE